MAKVFGEDLHAEFILISDKKGLPVSCPFNKIIGLGLNKVIKLSVEGKAAK